MKAALAFALMALAVVAAFGWKALAVTLAAFAALTAVLIPVGRYLRRNAQAYPMAGATTGMRDEQTRARWGDMAIDPHTANDPAAIDAALGRLDVARIPRKDTA